MTQLTLPKNWTRLAVAKAANVIMGQSPDSQFVNEDEVGIPFLQGNAEFTGKYPSPAHWVTKPTKLSNKDDILISVRAPVGEMNIANKEYCIGRGLAAIRFTEVDNQFGWYAISYHKAQLSMLAQGSTFTAVSAKDFSDFEIIYPNDLAEQRAIADILSTLDEAIAQSESLVRKYQSIKQGLMSDLLTHGAVNWNLSDIRREFDIESGFTLGQHRRPRKNTRKYLRVANVSRWDVNLDDLAEIEVYGKEMTIKSLRENDLLIIEGHANPNEIGRCAIATKQAEGLTYQNHIFRLRTKGLDHHFALIWLNSDWVRGYWRSQTSTSSGLYTINRTMLEKLPIPILSRPEQEKIADVIFSSDQQIKTEESQLNKLKNLKQGLMQDLLSGQMRVKV